MKKSSILIALLGMVWVSCTDKSNSVPKEAATVQYPFKNQLFHFFETEDAGFCDQLIPGPVEVFGAIYFTQKGNVIFTVVDQQSDTVRYFWGKYRFTDTTLTYHLTDEYYYPGRWDAGWMVAAPDYLKGQTRTVNLAEKTLLRSKCDKIPYYYPYSREEGELAAKRYQGKTPFGLYYQPYYEPKNQKYYTWLFQQIPVLRDL